MYRSNPAICKACPFRARCTESKDAAKRNSRRYVWAEYVGEADHLHHTEENKQI
ncbi:transposase [Paenibacillus thiaminolyticus]|uniref:transposase n=1 Tax=Paenibacillus thiaminolyticus TaxID=49283 RepID=UPI0035A63017